LTRSGNIYPCERPIGEDESPKLCSGKVHTGVDLVSRRGNRNEE